MPDKVRIGVIGTSWLEDQHHLPILKSHPQAEVTAICGRNPERANALAAKHGVPAVFADYRAMLEKAHLDAVVVASPDDLHYPMTMDALDFGLHVLCEKPLALSAGQAREMYERAEAKGVKHAVNFSWRKVPTYAYVGDLIAEGYLGRVYGCDISYLAGYARSGQAGWRFDPTRSKGAVANLGSHMIDLARLLVGEIARVSAHLSAPVPMAGSDGSAVESASQSAVLVVEFANGAQGTIRVSAAAHLGDRGQEQRVRLYGESGTLETDLELGRMWGEARGARATDGHIEALPIPDRFMGDPAYWHNPALAVLRLGGAVDLQFVDAIVSDRPMSPSFLDGLKTQEVIDAAIRSHESGMWEVVGQQDRAPQRG